MDSPVVAVFGSSEVGPADPEYAEGVRLGRLLAKAGFTMVTGGYAGVMEAVSEGAAEHGAEVLGVTAPPVFPGRSGANRHVTQEIPAASLGERIHHLIDLPDAYVVLPGSIGTLTELMVAWNVAFVTQFSDREPKPIVAVGEQWSELVPLLTERLETDASYVVCVSDVKAAAAFITEALR
ncbi:MAG: LOG family protein [Acidimicrobiia bacterium]